MDDFLSLIGDFFEAIANGGRKVFSGIGKAFCLFGDFLLDGIEWIDSLFTSRREKKNSKKKPKEYSVKENCNKYNMTYENLSNNNYSDQKEELYEIRNSILSTEVKNKVEKEKTFIKK